MIVLGIDVGKKSGVCVLDMSGARARYISADAIQDDLSRVLQGIFHEHAVSVIGIESPTEVFEHGRARLDKGVRIGIERALLIATRATGVVQAVAELFAAEVPIHEGEAHEVRRAILGNLPSQREDIDRYVGVMVPRIIDGWPDRSNDHERDAAVAALWAARRAAMPMLVPMKQPVKKARSPRARRTR